MSDRRYFVSIPNILLDIDLSENALRLYLRIKREAGDAGGLCEEKLEDLASKASMGKATASRAREELEQQREELDGRSLITVERQRVNAQAERHVIRVTDIWPENCDRYRAERDREQQTPGSSQNPAPVSDRTGPRFQSEPRAGSDQNRIVKNKNNKKKMVKPSRQAATSPQQELFEAIAGACGLDTTLLDATTRTNVGKLATALRRQSITPRFVRESGERWFTEKFGHRPRQDIRPPSVAQLKTWVGQRMAALPPEPPPDLDLRIWFQVDGKWRRRAPSLFLPNFGLDPYLPESDWPDEVQAAYAGAEVAA